MLVFNEIKRLINWEDMHRLMVIIRLYSVDIVKCTIDKLREARLQIIKTLHTKNEGVGSEGG
jgi:hypothetical protein